MVGILAFLVRMGNLQSGRGRGRAAGPRIPETLLGEPGEVLAKGTLVHGTRIIVGGRGSLGRNGGTCLSGC